MLFTLFLIYYLIVLTLKKTVTYRIAGMLVFIIWLSHIIVPVLETEHLVVATIAGWLEKTMAILLMIVCLPRKRRLTGMHMCALMLCGYEIVDIALWKVYYGEDVVFAHSKIYSVVPHIWEAIFYTLIDFFLVLAILTVKNKTARQSKTGGQGDGSVVP